jgi:hypothetical protein
MKVNVYIDGFNLYYGVVKDTKYKWLNVAQMCRLLLPNDQNSDDQIIRTVMQELGKPVGVLAPVRHGHPSYELTRNATFFKRIRDTVLAKSQFASTLTDAQGSIHKPSSW